MSLKTINLDAYYNSDNKSLIKSFYIPVLSESNLYKRSGAYFSSNSLAIAALGFANFIQNGGKIQLIANVELSEEDYNSIKDALDEKIINRIDDTFLSSLGQIQEKILEDHVKMLGWLVKNGRMEIKIAIVKKGIFHPKIAIFEDREGNKISFSGSINETLSGWINNYEQFHVFCNWDSEKERKHIEGDARTFADLWNNTSRRAVVYPISEAIKQSLIKLAPSDDPEFQLLLKTTKEAINRLIETGLYEPKERILLREYQKEAIQAWIANNYKGIFDMATGTGKTITALGALEEIKKTENRIVIIIVCPYQILVDQWNSIVKSFFTFKPILGYSSNNWEVKLNSSINLLNSGILNELCIITTYASLQLESMQANIKKINSKIIIIADEIHHISSEASRSSLPDAYYRLGLSATPYNYRDPEGSNLMMDYFDKVVFNFTLNEAIKRGFLNQYQYYPIVVQLNTDDMDRYIEISEKIAKRFSIIADEDSRDKCLDIFYFKRAKILNKNSNKLGALKKLIAQDIENGDTKYTLIYCQDKEQLTKVSQMVYELGLVPQRITSDENDPELRRQILKNFESGISVLLAIGVLDEGVDLPIARKAYLLASSSNPRQFIQRRGRLLRLLKDQKGNLLKKEVKIFDLISAPPKNYFVKGGDQFFGNKIIEREFKRFEEFSSSAKNQYQARVELRKAFKEWGVNVV